MEYYEDRKSVDVNEYVDELSKELDIYISILNTLKTIIFPFNELKTQAREYIINLKLDRLKNNYISERTPMGNVYMRYNNLKNTFEYFSNNTIPYRYLETISRKYVTTFWCKPIYIDIEEELEKSEKKLDEDLNKEKINEEMKKLNKEIEKKNFNASNKEPKKSVLAKFKNYNKDVNNKNVTVRPSNSNTLLPELETALSTINKIPTKQSKKQLLKLNVNRYTCEGRINDMILITKVIDNKSTMSFADFKRLQQDK